MGRDYTGVWIELERCEGCDKHKYCTRHEEWRYEQYEKECLQTLTDLQDEKRIPFVMNPGPSAHGMKCRPVKHAQTVLYESMHMDKVTRKWSPTGVFRYPRLGAFEVYVCRGKQREEVFSKLKTMRWPNKEWLAKRVEEIVRDRFDGWITEAPVIQREKASYSGVGGKQTLSDNDLRQHIKSKFHTLNAAFRSLDKNGDGVIDKNEFLNGMRKAAIDLPPQVLEEMWNLADADGSGAINYLEFCRKFSTFNASHSLHRHASVRLGQEIVDKLHGMGASSRIATSAKIRLAEKTTWEIDEEQFDPNAAAHSRPQTISQLARELGDTHIDPELLTVDLLRARMVNLHGSLLNAFRHFDVDGSSSVSFDEWNRYLPKVYGENFPRSVGDRLWRQLDTEQKGEIQLTSFFEDHLFDPNHIPLRVLRGMAVDATVPRHPVSTALSPTRGPKRGDMTPSPRSPLPDQAAPAAALPAAPAAPAARAAPATPSLAEAATALREQRAGLPQTAILEADEDAGLDIQEDHEDSVGDAGLEDGAPGGERAERAERTLRTAPSADGAAGPVLSMELLASADTAVKAKRPSSGASMTASTADLSMTASTSDVASMSSSRPPSAVSQRPQSAAKARGASNESFSRLPGNDALRSLTEVASGYSDFSASCDDLGPKREEHGDSGEYSGFEEASGTESRGV